MPAPTHFHQELANLRINVLEMAAHAEKALEKATTALLTRDAELAQDVINHDELINELECVIDEKSLRMLALEQPVAKDLRFIVGCMRTIVNLERIGDEAVNIAERALILSHRPALPFNHILEELSNLCLEMLRSSINAFKEEDPEMAQKVCDMDSRANELDVTILKKLIDYMLKESSGIERSVHTILSSRSMERVGDLCTNVAECVIFIVKGVNIKHKCGLI